MEKVPYLPWVNICLAYYLNSVLNVKAVVAAFNQEKALVGAFSVIVQLHRLIVCSTNQDRCCSAAPVSLCKTAAMVRCKVQCSTVFHENKIGRGEVAEKSQGHQQHGASSIQGLLIHGSIHMQSN